MPGSSEWVRVQDPHALPSFFTTQMNVVEFKPLSDQYEPILQWRHVKTYLHEAKAKAHMIQKYSEAVAQANEKNIKAILAGLMEQKRLAPLISIPPSPPKPSGGLHAQANEDPVALIDAILASASLSVGIADHLQCARNQLTATWTWVPEKEM